MSRLTSLALAALLVLACSPRAASGPGPTASGIAAATSTAVPTATAASAATPTSAGICQNTYQQGDQPIVAPRKSGQSLEVALDAVRPGQNGHNRWMVRFFVPSGAPGNAVIPLDAAVTGPAGALQTFGYVAGPPNAGTAPVTQPVTVVPCGQQPTPPPTSAVVLGVETSAVTSGTYTLTWRGIRRPEGDTASETWTVALTCLVSPGAPGATPATECK